MKKKKLPRNILLLFCDMSIYNVTICNSEAACNYYQCLFKQ